MMCATPTGSPDKFGSPGEQTQSRGPVATARPLVFHAPGPRIGTSLLPQLRLSGEQIGNTIQFKRGNPLVSGLLVARFSFATQLPLASASKAGCAASAPKARLPRLRSAFLRTKLRLTMVGIASRVGVKIKVNMVAKPRPKMIAVES